MLKVTPVVLDRLLVILLTIPLTDQSLEMNLYRVHNLPLTAPDLHMTAIYSLEGEYLAIGKKGHVCGHSWIGRVYKFVLCLS